jgi:hypothetical protein
MVTVAMVSGSVPVFVTVTWLGHTDARDRGIAEDGGPRPLEQVEVAGTGQGDERGHDSAINRSNGASCARCRDLVTSG